MGAELTAERALVNLIRGAGVHGAGIRTISQLRSRARSKEIHLPSGDQCGWMASSPWLVICRGAPPSAFASSLVLFPARLKSNTIQRESGDQEDSGSDQAAPGRGENHQERRDGR